MNRHCISFFLLLVSILIYGQKPQKPNAVEIYNQIQKLNFLGSVLYVAAHPDDENTRLISYFSNNIKARTAYLSLTRGDGGQNLIGNELGELLGVIRTQELVEARKIDGGEQFFTRAIDFGFSKNPNETLNIWDKEKVLNDIIWTIRNFQPDIIINRFDHRSPGTTHGHHTASALLSNEAFQKANDSSFFKEQLKLVNTWKPKRQFFNTSWWFYGSKEKFDNANKSDLVKLETGVYFASLGKSNQEIAALSRSSHQSQGFGTTGSRGEETEYLEFINGETLNNKSNLFDGIDTSWNRVKGGKPIGELLAIIEKNYDFKNPSASVGDLLKAYELIQKLEDKHWKKIKTEDIKSIIAACSGLYLEATSESREITPGSEININLEAINRSNLKMKWKGISTFSHSDNLISETDLYENKNITKNIKIQLPDDLDYTSPYWLKENSTLGMFKVDDQKTIGLPDLIRKVIVTFNLEINGVTIPFDKKVVYKYNDKVKGEIYHPFDIIPIATSSISEKVIIFNSEKTKTVSVKIIAGKNNLQGNIQLKTSSNWTVFPKNIPFKIAAKGSTHEVLFRVTPPKETGNAVIQSIITIDGKELNKEQFNVDYNHINRQMVLKPSEAKAIRLKIKTKNEKIAYIMGAGDEIPNCLSQMGYDVTIVNPAEITNENLSQFDVIMTGIRAYNVVNKLTDKQKILLNYVKNGKTMIVQYNTTDNLVTSDMSPYLIKISQDRVTEENAEVRFLNPNHPVLNYPNKITSEDFDGWVQERGLYYPDQWDNNFTPILSSNDEGESPKNGGLLISKYGKGNFIYTSLSFFRELPEGVSGAYRLMANIIALGN